MNVPILIAALAMLPFFIGCQAGPVSTRPNILLISVDTMRLDHCSVYGYERSTTPNLERLASKGLRCDRAYAPTATTGPTHATIFTSLYPMAHRVVKNGLPLDDEIETLAELLQKRSYETAAFTGSFVLDASFGYDQGFDYYDDDFQIDEATFPTRNWEGVALEGGFDRRATLTTDLAIEWLTKTREAEDPFFLFLHYFDPHAPYEPPIEFRDRFVPGVEAAMTNEEAIGRYDEEIAYTDHEMGRLFDALDASGLTENTLIIVTADHGEGLNTHGFFGHAVHLYEEAVRVPLIFRWDGKITPGSVLDAPIELVDLLPTVLSLVEAPESGGDFQGEDLAGGILRGEPLDMSRPVFLERQKFVATSVGGVPTIGPKFGVRKGKWKFIIAPEEGTQELFNLETDPGESENLATALPDQALALAKSIEKWKILHERESGAERSVSAEDQEKLRSLGYIN